MDPERLIFDFGLVMALLLVAPLISARLRLPDIVGLILAGVAVGEHGMGLFRLDATFQLLGAVGLLYLMFLAGLEINLNEFHRYRKPSLVFGLATFLIPQVAGTLGAVWLLGFGWPKAILLASMFASHTLIPFPLVQRLGLGRHRSVTTTIGGTILTDTAALLVLAIIVKGGFHSPDAVAAGAGFWVQMALTLALLVVGATFLLPKLGYAFFRRVAPDGTAEFIFVLAATFLTAYASELAGVEPIIGAFLAGLALSPLLPGRGVLMSRVHFVGHALFIPFFLLSVGMRVNVRVLSTGLDGWLVALYMTICVTATKWLAARLSGRLLGYDRTESNVIFGLSVNQAAATLAAVLVGVRVGIFDAAVLNGTILMILVTCLIGPLVTDRSARRLAEQDTRRSTGPRAESGRVLVPLSSPERAEAIIDLALMIRPEGCSEPVYPMSVALDGPDVAERLAAAERLLGGAVARLVAANTPVVPLARIDLNVAGGILHAAMEFRISAIVIGWQAPRRHAHFFHTIPETLITLGTPSILVFRPGERLNTVKRLWIAVPPLIERHPGIANALQTARRIASQAGARPCFAGTEGTFAVLRGTPGALLPTDAVSSRAFGTWAEVIQHMEQEHHEQDGIVLISSRRGQLAWQPSLERLPVAWAERWPKANLIVLYPPLPEPGEAEEPAEEPGAGGETATAVFHLKPTIIAVGSAEAGDALREMLQTSVRGNSAEIDALVASVLETGAVPLSSEVALMHTHTALVDHPRVLVGKRFGGFRVARCPIDPTHLVLLLSPLGGPAEQHLRSLAAIAQGVRDGSLLAGAGWREGER